MRGEEGVAGWLEALDRRHLADLTPSEAARALRALSSCYVERRAKLARGGALESAGKRAAFALFYAPLHFLVVREIVRALGRCPAVSRAGSSIWAAARAPPAPPGRSKAGAARSTGSIATRGRSRKPTGRIAPWASAAGPGRATWSGSRCEAKRARDSRGLHRQRAARRHARRPAAAADRGAPNSGSRVLIVEPIARRMAGWWTDWETRVRRPPAAAPTSGGSPPLYPNGRGSLAARRGSTRAS